jgi:hypothetical protein
MSHRAIKMLYLELMDAIAEIKDGPMCADNNHMDLFYPDPNKGNSKVRSAEFRMRIMEQEAKILCGLCPVKALCAEYAIKAKEDYGIWGGTTPAERKAIYGSSNKPGPSTARQLF